MISPLTMENIADAVMAEGLASRTEIDQLVTELYEFANTTRRRWLYAAGSRSLGMEGCCLSSYERQVTFDARDIGSRCGCMRVDDMFPLHRKRSIFPRKFSLTLF